MIKRVGISVAIILAIATSITVFAASGDGWQQGRGMFGRRHPFAHRMLGRIAAHLGLTDEQKQQIKAIVEAERPTVEPLVKQLAENRKQLREATKGGQFNEEQVRAIAVKQGQTIAELIVEKEKVKAKIYATLTEEQKAKADELGQRIEGRIKERIRERIGN